MNHEIRRMIVEHGDAMRDVVISASQVQTVVIVKDLTKSGVEVTSSELANQLSISVQSASSRLEKLYNKKYLKRYSRLQPSGGQEYVYTVAIYDCSVD